MQDNTLLTLCTKKLLLTQSFSLPTMETKFFLKNSGRDDSYGVYQKTSIKTELFILLTLDTCFSTQMQDNTLLTVFSEELLLKLLCFLLLTVNTIFFLKKKTGRDVSHGV